MANLLTKITVLYQCVLRWTFPQEAPKLLTLAIFLPFISRLLPFLKTNHFSVEQKHDFSRVPKRAKSTTSMLCSKKFCWNCTSIYHDKSKFLRLLFQLIVSQSHHKERAISWNCTAKVVCCCFLHRNSEENCYCCSFLFYDF